jgi:hypothetical protein
MITRGAESDRLRELLAGEAAGDLAGEERAELQALVESREPGSRDELMTVAGLAQLAFLKADPQAVTPMSAELEARLLAQASVWTAARGSAG